MGQWTTTTSDIADQKVTGTFTTTGSSTSIPLYGAFNVALWGVFSATVQLQRSFDGGTTWIPMGSDVVGTAASYTAPASCRVVEPEMGVNYRLTCTAFTSGTVNYRISASIPRTSDTTN